MRNLILCIALVSCGYKTTELPPGLSERSLGSGQAGVNFATVSAQVFGPSCVRCHGSSGGVNLSTYAGARAALGRIAGAVNSGSMPPGGPLSQTLKDLLNSWITAGGPEFSTGGGGTTTGGTTTGGTTTGGGTDDDCEDDDRLMGAGLVKQFTEEWVYDFEKEIVRRKQNGCNEDR